MVSTSSPFPPIIKRFRACRWGFSGAAFFYLAGFPLCSRAVERPKGRSTLANGHVVEVLGEESLRSMTRQHEEEKTIIVT